MYLKVLVFLGRDCMNHFIAVSSRSTVHTAGFCFDSRIFTERRGEAESPGTTGKPTAQNARAQSE